MNEMVDNTSIFVQHGDEPGPTLAVFCGVHGNETAGILAVKEVLRKKIVQRGTVYFVFANPRAIEQGIRFSEKNLNRCFTVENNGTTYEEERARELMPLLDNVDALLDLHASNIPDSTPFLICEENTFACASNLDFDIVSTGWDVLEPGATDGYMYRQGKVGICAECGFAGAGENYASLAVDTIHRFLTFFGCSDSIVLSPRKQQHLHVDTVVMKKDVDFTFTKNYNDFEALPAGICFATSGNKKYITDKDAVIMFANPKKEVGGEACILGSWVNT